MEEEDSSLENDGLEESEKILSIPLEDRNGEEDKNKTKCDFTIMQVIGEGAFATVRLGINNQTNEQVAIKIMEKNKIVQEEDKIKIEREKMLHQNLRHPNIVQLYSVIEKNDKIYLIMEYVKGKELFDYIVFKKKLTEMESCLFFQQIISGIEYLHKIKYVHRDIKPENLLINQETKELKIIDFGFSNNCTNPNKNLLESACGSPYYAAPEMLSGQKYRAPPVDIWSSGIVLFTMICGYLPFEDEDNNLLYEKIRKGKFVIPKHVSEQARDLLNNILVTDPQKRFTINQIKNHPWFSLYNNKGKLMVNEGLNLFKYIIPIDEDVVSSMSNQFGINEQKIRISILSNKHDGISTIYYLLLQKKIKNKKKSVADIKSDLFRKYLESKSNLLETYNKDLNKIIEERKNGCSNENKYKVSRINLESFQKDRGHSSKIEKNITDEDDMLIDMNKTERKKESRIMTRFRTNNNIIKSKLSFMGKEKNEIKKNVWCKMTLNKSEIIDKEGIDDEKIKNDNLKEKEKKKINKYWEIFENKEEDTHENKNLIKHREKKVNNEKKVVKKKKIKKKNVKKGKIKQKKKKKKKNQKK
jgi:5'-AMP-activated protein kinase catalytic alpha subunit